MYRDSIDEIDKEIVRLFEKRVEIALKVSEYKRMHNMDILQKGREEEVIKKAVSELKNPEYKSYIVEIMNTLMSISRDIQKKNIEK